MLSLIPEGVLMVKDNTKAFSYINQEFLKIINCDDGSNESRINEILRSFELKENFYLKDQFNVELEI